MEGAFQQQHASINMQNEEVLEAKIATDQMVTNQNKNQEKMNEMSHNLEELLTWKREMTKQQFEENDKYIKIETNEEEDDEITINNEYIEMETDYEIDEVEKIEDELEQIMDTTIAVQNESLRIKWYKFSAKFIPEEYRFQYVHADAESRNRKKVFEWFEKCEKMGLIPEEFQLIPEEIEPREKCYPENKKSFHRRRKEEWKKRKASKNKFKVKEEKKQKEKKEHVFNKAKTRPPSLRFMFFTMMAIYLLGFGAATPVNPNGYRPTATKQDFRDVQHNPKLIDHLRDLNHVTRNISTVHADHVAIQTFVHEIKYVIEDAEDGIDQSCNAIIALSEECEKVETTCQYVAEGMHTR